MGFSYFVGAPFFPCWSDGAKIYAVDPLGNPLEFECHLGVQVPQQIVPFRSSNVLWCLKHEGVLYVGRKDSTFSGFDSSGTLVRYGGWCAPPPLPFAFVGHFSGIPAYLHTGDNRTLYIPGLDRIYRLYHPLMEGHSQHLTAASLEREESGLCIYCKGGKMDVDTAGSWFAAAKQPRADQCITL